MENEISKDIYKTTRCLYVIEAGLEYLISILLTGVYLAKLTSSIGISDALTGIISSFVSLGFGFQVIAIFLANKRPVKRWVTVLHFLDELFFSLIYFVPGIRLSKGVKTVLFIAFLLLGYSINNVIYAPKLNWFMSLADSGKRGRFSANRDMFSLIIGMIFSLAMGAIIDRFEELGNLDGAFIVCGISIFILMLFHSATLIFSKEKPIEEKEKISTKQSVRELIKDKNLFKVILISVLWYMVEYVATPFYGSYQIKELGFTMTFVSVLSISYAIVRALFAKPMGKFADKYSFAKMLNICLIIMFVGFGINMFTTPANGKVLYTIYYMLNAIAMAGINSAAVNMIYDYVDEKNRIGAIALNGSLAGFAGFFTTLAVSPLVSYIQNNGNSLFGLSVYAQQVVSAIAVILLIVLIIYLNTVVKKLRKN